MAKKVHRTSKRPKQARARSRVSTRPVVTRTRARQPPISATRARAGGETVQVTFALRDVSDRQIRDPETFFTFRRLSDNSADRRSAKARAHRRLAGLQSACASRIRCQAATGSWTRFLQ